MHLLLASHGGGGADACCVLVVFGIVVFFAIFAAIKGNAARTEFDRIQQQGTPALGIVLRIDPTGTTIQGSATYFSGLSASGGSVLVRNNLHRRNAVVDVEIPGQPPYQVGSLVVMPLNLSGDVLPGSTVELRVDPKNRNNIVIVGPGSGFAGFSQIPVTFQQDGSK